MPLSSDLESAILKINETYNTLSNNYTGEIFNFRKVQVKDTIGSDNIIKSNYQTSFDNYRQYLTDNLIILATLKYDLEDIFKDSDTEIYKINQRIKAPNSIYEKIRRYCDKSEHGDISLLKCLNDFFGIRLVFTNLANNEDDVLNELESLKNEKIIRKYYVRKDGIYIGIHITINENDNYRYPWELQLWDKSNFESNMLSHDKHKKMTEYTNKPNQYFSKMEK